MPVRRYRRVDDVPPNSVVEDGGPAVALRAAFSLSALALRLAGGQQRSGVYKCRSLEEAQALHEGLHDGAPDMTGDVSAG